MLTADQHGLPRALAERLGDEARAAFAEAPREARFRLLAQALNLDEAALLAELARLTGLEVLAEPAIDAEGLKVLPARIAAEAQVVPTILAGAPEGRLNLVTALPPDAATMDWVATFTPRRPKWFLAPPERVAQLINENYGVGSGSLDDEGQDLPVQAEAATDGEADQDAAVVRFVTDVLSQGVAEGATDVHFEPQEGHLRIRYRIDGLLVAVPLPENLARFQDAIISRLKIMARLNISERRLPQDGRINFRDGKNVLDIRVSTIPTIYAESVSLRLLNQRKEAYDMDRIGMSPDEQALVRKVLDYPHGIILVTGPTGSGKSTSLNAFLREINSPELRIVTIEDAFELGIEHFEASHPDHDALQARAANIEGQGEINMSDLTRMALRMDPDRVIVGEVRGAEAFPMLLAMSQGNNGSMCTLHADSARSTFPKLLAYVSMASMGLPTDTVNLLVASAIHFVVHIQNIDGRRRVTSIIEVTDAEGSSIISNEVFSYSHPESAFMALRAQTSEVLSEFGFQRPTGMSWSA